MAWHFEHVPRDIELLLSPVSQLPRILIDLLSDEVLGPLPQQDSLLFYSHVDVICQFLLKLRLRLSHKRSQRFLLLGQNYRSSFICQEQVVNGLVARLVGVRPRLLLIHVYDALRFNYQVEIFEDERFEFFENFHDLLECLSHGQWDIIPGEGLDFLIEFIDGR